MKGVLIAGIVCSILILLLCILSGDWYLLPAFLASMFAIITPFLLNNDDKASRVSCFYASIIPGCGHIYLNLKKQAIGFLTLLITSFLLLGLFKYYPNEAEYVLVAFSLIIIMSIIASIIDSQKWCDHLDLPSVDPNLEIHINNRKRALITSMIIICVLFISYSIFSFFVSSYNSMPIIICSIMFIIDIIIIWNNGRVYGF